MTQEDKDLLVKDLGGRVSYDVKVNVNSEYLSEELIKAGYDKPLVVYGVTADGSISFTLDKFLMEYSMPILSIKPYLFPLSSMTKEQKEEIEDKLIFPSNSNGGWIEILYNDIYNIPFWFVDFCNKNHFDYRGLISKGLALDATDLNIY